jgi:hypothetical protein
MNAVDAATAVAASNLVGCIEPQAADQRTILTCTPFMTPANIYDASVLKWPTYGVVSATAGEANTAKDQLQQCRPKPTGIPGQKYCSAAPADNRACGFSSVTQDATTVVACVGYDSSGAGTCAYPTTRPGYTGSNMLSCGLCPSIPST